MLTRMALRVFADVDLVSGLAAVGWAIAGQWVPELAALCSPTVAFGFGGAAILRGLWAIRRRIEASHG